MNILNNYLNICYNFIGLTLILSETPYNNKF